VRDKFTTTSSFESPLAPISNLRVFRNFLFSPGLSGYCMICSPLW
jgi:hypothetical protein